ncbi:aromatic acid exporter family protein [Paenibacillus eucommiae]|uniref:Uncharacterized membrane protein YgaE (UPF0421/DUF939 family) n=1 Tax=Paenibacillus eucommiae TaxID=1355755 RepID=A0ABS4J6N9_9BACL|nr:aromatic acid exporter family protein [Paenibacillus eucommiae]MBP1995493.1 uncharacterized membrane protein YgaE (UPF0421/DUF939 family) [Paenibacillus eucommiae]
MGFRVVKTAIAVVISIYIAQFLGLIAPLSAGLLAIIGVEVTKKKGIRSALQRIAASVLCLLFGSLMFVLFGFHIWLIGVFVLIVFPLLHRMRISEGAVTGSVVMFHIYAGGSVTFAGIWNEVLLLIVGLGTAILINIAYMPKAEKKILAHKLEVEQFFSGIFLQIAAHLRDNSMVWDGKEILDASAAVDNGSELARKSLDNTLIFGGETYWRVYFYMRGEQLESITRMAALVAQIYSTLPQGASIASIFEGLSADVKEEYYTGRTEEVLLAMEQQFKQMPLPQTREEFEVRSAMLQLNLELKHYLSIAKKQKKQKPENS